MQTFHVSQNWAEDSTHSKMRMWNLYMALFKKFKSEFAFELLGIVIMPNHSHLLLKTNSIDKVLEQLNFPLVEPPWNELIRNYARLVSVYKYIHRNPVSIGLVSRVEDYPFSSLNLLKNKSEQRISCGDPFYFICNPQRVLDWLNHPERISPFYQTITRENLDGFSHRELRFS